MNTLPPGRYRVHVLFDTGADERIVVTEAERDPYYVFHQALADMRLASPYGGPGVNGKVQHWAVGPDHSHMEKA